MPSRPSRPPQRRTGFRLIVAATFAFIGAVFLFVASIAVAFFIPVVVRQVTGNQTPVDGWMVVLLPLNILVLGPLGFACMRIASRVLGPRIWLLPASFVGAYALVWVVAVAMNPTARTWESAVVVITLVLTSMLIARRSPLRWRRQRGDSISRQ